MPVIFAYTRAGFGDFLGCAADMAATLGVATLSYVPFTFFNLLNPLVSILYAFIGFRMLKNDPRLPEEHSGKGGAV